jgi:large subunit ribosomal protein L13
MGKYTIRTYTAKPADIKREWHVIDASGKTLGRLSSRIAILLMGKHKPIFSPASDTGDYVIVINAGKVRVTGNKATQKTYYRHSMYPGGFKSETYDAAMQRDPTWAVEHAVKGMLPHNFVSAKMKKRLRVYAGDTYPDLPQVKAKKAPAETEKPAAEAKASAGAG